MTSSDNKTETNENNNENVPPLGAFFIIMGFNWMLSIETYLSKDGSGTQSDTPIITLTRVLLTLQSRITVQYEIIV